MPDDSHRLPKTQARDDETKAEGGHRGAHQGGRLPRHRRPRHLPLVAGTLLILAGGTAAWGITSRDHSERALADWTRSQAVPTVAVIHPATSQATRKLTLPGDVEAFYEAPIYARVSGYLESWQVDIGARVRSGQTLGLIETPELDQELAQARADLAAAQARENLAELTSKRWQTLLATNSVSHQSADEKQGDALAIRADVVAQHAHLDRLRALESFKRLAAPFDGVVTVRNTDVGALINAGSSATAPLFKVADMHEMRVYVHVPQAYAADLIKDLSATLVEPQYPGVTFPARLETTSVSVALESRTVLVELMAPNPDGRLWAGTFAEVTFALPGDASVLRVPASALVFRSHGAQLATVTRQGRVALRDVRIGRNLGTEIEIEGGVSADDQVIVSPLDTLEDGQAVAIESTGRPAAGA